MKKVSIVLALVVVTFLVSCGAKDKRLKFTDAVKYNDYIVDIVDEVDDAWTSAIEEEDQKQALAWSDTLANRSKNGLAKLNNLQPFKKDSTFRDAGIKYLTHMNNISNKELKEFINIIRAEEMTIEGEQRAEALIPMLDDEREKLFSATENAQSSFATKFNITIVK
jgi:transposase